MDLDVDEPPSGSTVSEVSFIGDQKMPRSSESSTDIPSAARAPSSLICVKRLRAAEHRGQRLHGYPHPLLSNCCAVSVIPPSAP